LSLTFSGGGHRNLIRFRNQSDPYKYYKANEMLNNPTPAEMQMWAILYWNVIPYFPMHIFYPQSVQYGYILDFYCPTLQLCIEVDGSVHNLRKEYDWMRDSNLAGWGIQVFRVSNSEVFNNPQGVANQINQIIQSKTKPLSNQTPQIVMIPSSSPWNYCPDCGTKIENKPVFCGKCGRKLDAH
jgi:very-short-patch-repair endonuclease